MDKQPGVHRAVLCVDVLCAVTAAQVVLRRAGEATASQLPDEAFTIAESNEAGNRESMADRAGLAVIDPDDVAHDKHAAARADVGAVPVGTGRQCDLKRDGGAWCDRMIELKLNAALADVVRVTFEDKVFAIERAGRRLGRVKKTVETARRQSGVKIGNQFAYRQSGVRQL